jgi:hypothetical protein
VHGQLQPCASRRLCRSCQPHARPTCLAPRSCTAASATKSRSFCRVGRASLFGEGSVIGAGNPGPMRRARPPSATRSDTITSCPRSRSVSPLRVCLASWFCSSSRWPLEHRGAQPHTGAGLCGMTVGCRLAIGLPAPALRSFLQGPFGWYLPPVRLSARHRCQRTFLASGLGSSSGCLRSIRRATSPGGIP